MRVSALDHIVLNVADVERALRFYTEVLGLKPERLDLWRAGRVSFPSVRISEGTIIDLFPGTELSEGADVHSNVNHFCLVMEGDLEPAIGELEGQGVVIERGLAKRWGARGDGQAVYFRDPDGNLIELRSYAPMAAKQTA
jgi:catechol 2,3-dioxygenase-like lactoylglutathione lyase family enzyme